MLGFSVEMLGAIAFLLTAVTGLLTGFGVFIGRLWGNWSDHVALTRDLHQRLKQHADAKEAEAKDADSRADAAEAKADQEKMARVKAEDERRDIEVERGETLRRLTSMESELVSVHNELVQVKEQLERLLVSHKDLEQQREIDLAIIAELEERDAEKDEAIEDLETRLITAERKAEELALLLADRDKPKE